MSWADDQRGIQRSHRPVVAIEGHQPHSDWILYTRATLAAHRALRRNAEYEVSQSTSRALSHCDQIGYCAEPLGKLELVAVGGGAYKNAGRADVALLRRLVGGSEAPPVQHVAVDRRERLAREDELVPGGVLGAPQVQDALHQPVIIKIPSRVPVIAAAEVEEQVAVRSLIAPGLIGHGTEHKRTDTLRRGSLADVDDSPVVHLGIAGSVCVLRPVEAPADRQRKVHSCEEEPPIMLSQALS